MKHLNLSNSKACEPRIQEIASRCRIMLRVTAAALLLTIVCNSGFGQSPNTKTDTDKPAASLDHAPPAPSHTVSGTVRDANGDPLPGVSIYLRGTTYGTISDPEGRFQFPRKLAEGDQLTFSFVGRESVEYVIQKDTGESLSIVMNDGAEIMGEVAANDVYSTKGGFRQWLSNLKRND